MHLDMVQSDLHMTQNLNVTYQKFICDTNVIFDIF